MLTITFNLHSRSYTVKYERNEKDVYIRLYETIEGKLSHLLQWYADKDTPEADIIARAASFITLQKETVC